ncbi:MAG: four helix bundle protein [Bacteroidota bacterium]
MNTQIRRAATSTTQNIAEGYGRFHHREAIQFYRISRGSIYELKDILISCLDFEFIKPELFEKGVDLLEKAKVTLNGYIKYIQKLLLEKK